MRLLDGQQLRPSDCMLSAANGTSLTVRGEVDVDVMVGSTKVSTRFIVTDNVIEPILGIDWLYENADS